MATLLATWEEPGRIALDAAVPRLKDGLLDAVEAGLAACELDPNLLAIGLGSLPNSDGELELDAAVMDGTDLSAGAVCAVRGIVPVISVARRVMERTPHVMLAGDQARRFAIQQGMEVRNLMTAESCERYARWREGHRPDEYIHSVADGHGDTVTMLGEQDGHLVAASSTSGISWKLPGRVGDSPIIGAGIYADDEIGAAGATGLGEELWKACAGYRTVAAMERGLSARDACEETVRQMIRRQPASLSMPCVVLALRKDGDFAAATTVGTFHLWSWVDGVLQVQTFSGLA